MLDKPFIIIIIIFKEREGQKVRLRKHKGQGRPRDLIGPGLQHRGGRGQVQPIIRICIRSPPYHLQCFSPSHSFTTVYQPLEHA